MSAEQPKKVVREALVRFFDTVDTDFDRLITAEDLVNFCRDRKANLPEETARAMFADAKRRRWHNGLSPHHIGPRDVACALSSRRTPGNAWTPAPFREQWIYLVGLAVPAADVFERRSVAPVRPTAPMTGKELFASMSRSPTRRPHTSHGASRVRVRDAPRRRYAHNPAPHESPRAGAVSAINATMALGGVSTSGEWSGGSPVDVWGVEEAEASSSAEGTDCGGGRLATPQLVAGRESPTCGFGSQASYNNFGQALQNDAAQAVRSMLAAGRVSPGMYELLLAKTMTGISPPSAGSPSSPAPFVHQIPTRELSLPYEGRPISAIGHIKPHAPLERLFAEDRTKALDEAARGHPMREKGWTQPVGYGRVPTITDQKNAAAKKQPNFFGAPIDYREVEYVARDGVAARASCRPRARGGGREGKELRHSFMADWASEHWTKEVEPRKISKIDLKPAELDVREGATPSVHLLDRTGRAQIFHAHLHARAVPRRGDWLRQNDSAIPDVNDSPMLDSACWKMRQEELAETRRRQLAADVDVVAEVGEV